MRSKLSFALSVCLLLALLAGTSLVSAQAATPAATSSDPCAALPDHDAVTAAIKTAQAEKNGGFGLNMWATVVNRDGVVCVVTFTGNDRGDQWPGSRVIAAQKANTANDFSLPKLALSTANIYSAVQPGGSLYGLQFSNPVDTSVAYGGDPADWGQVNDPMVGQHIGGVNVFGGGLALYAADGTLLGAVGVSGDSSCADHNIAWRTRHALKLDYVPAGVSPTNDDNIVYDITNGVSKSGWGHPECSADATSIGNALVTTDPISKAS